MISLPFLGMMISWLSEDVSAQGPVASLGVLERTREGGGDQSDVLPRRSQRIVGVAEREGGEVSGMLVSCVRDH